MARYNLDTTTLGQAMADPDVVAIAEKFSPGIANNPMLGMAKQMTIRQALQLGSSMIGTDKVNAIIEQIDQLD